MKNRIIFLLIAYLLVLMLPSCKKAIVDNSNISNINIEGWEIDSIDFNYNWISPEDVDFLNSKTGYILGSNGDLLKTTDYAKSWVQSFIEKDSSGVMTSTMSFINDSTGYIYGTWNVLNGNFYGILYKTVDGGNHWTKRYYSTAYHLLSMKFFDASHGIALNWASSPPSIVTTGNGGLSWDVRNAELNPSVNRLFYLGEICYATSSNQKILKSTDHGISWSTINTPVSSLNFIYGFYFLNVDIGFLDLGDKRYKTTNGGNTWKEINLSWGFMTPSSAFEYFHFCNDNDGILFRDVAEYIGGDFPTFIGTYIYTTTDGGNNWERSDLLKQSFGAVVYVSDNLAYCTSNKYIYKLQKK
jgi:photosystem II stability/assembly factor-like uncharacterized protein